MSISVEEAIRKIREHTQPLGEEEVSLEDSLNRVLSRDLIAAIMQPPFDRSPLDGYAVRGEDIANADREHPVSLRVVDKLYAGSCSMKGIGPGEAVRLMTGAMIPEGADCVIRQEDTDEGEALVRIFSPVKAGQNICRRGEEYMIGECLLPKDSLMDAASLAVAAGTGSAGLWVKKQLTAAVISTGDEVGKPGEPLAPGKIYDTNSCYIAARLHQLGVRISAREWARDDCASIRRAIERCAEKADLVITTGGVSVGQKDLVERAVTEFGADLVFHGIHMKPGMPTLFAVKEKKMILGLSGNPFSAAVPFELFLREILAAALNCPGLGLRKARGRAGNDFKKKSPTRRFLRAYCENGTVLMPGQQANGQMRSMIGCNCLVDVAAGTEQIRAGDPVDIFWI